MKDSLNCPHKTLERRLLYREIHASQKDSSVPALYGSKNWVDNLDITHELYGHGGCVNALSWSRNGNLLASGSDDTYINIHTINPTFAFNTSIETGHRANIFSVKFMPFWNDRKIISAAGDWEIRIFDVEYAPTGAVSPAVPPPRPSTPPPAISFRNRMRSRRSLPKPAKLYTSGEANPKVYMSHHDRVKRIVTESSPYLFLTCSEDGEVRQFDLRQPSEFYARSSGRGPSVLNFLGVEIIQPGPTDDHRNPPLISYKNHRIELNSLSCSTGQPHYIALGGSHQHCFLHDRRMLGRDLNVEAGQPGGPDYSAPTRCVRRFASPIQRSNAHITGCKISDAYPDELVVSWNADKVYLFDINRSPDADELKNKKKGPKAKEGTGEGRVKQEKERKGKEKATPSPRWHSSARKRKREEAAMAGSREGTAEAQPSIARLKENVDAVDNAAEEGQVQHIEYRDGHGNSVNGSAFIGSSSPSTVPDVPGEGMMRIAGLVVDLRKELFGLQSSKTAPEAESEERKLKRSWTAALGLAKVCIERMNAIIEDVEEQSDGTPSNSNELLEDGDFLKEAIRHNRIIARRFVQAAGTIARCLGGELRHLGNTNVALQHFSEIQGRMQGQSPDDYLGLRFSFIKLIAAFLDGGKAQVEEISSKDFGEGSGDPLENVILDLRQKAEELQDLRPIRDVDDQKRVVLDSEIAALDAFVEVVRKDEERNFTVKKFWGAKIARALLLREGEGVNFEFVHLAFKQTRPHAEDDEPSLESLSIRRRRGSVGIGTIRQNSLSRRRRRRLELEGEEYMDFQLEEYLSIQPGDSSQLTEEDNEATEEAVMGFEEATTTSSEEDGGGDDNDDDDDFDAESEGDEEEEENERETIRHDIFRTAGSSIRRRKSPAVEQQAPIWNRIRSYAGHCNVKTVKDVNFFGLNDEYVVSGSDCGHIFIWDKKTSKLVQLLHGDDDTVNVITGHPYLPQLAASGMDDTIKIFGPDQMAQQEFFSRGRLGPRNDEEEMMDVTGDMLGASPGCRPTTASSTSPPTSLQGGGIRSRRRMYDEYRIRSQNEAMNETGLQEAIVTRTMLESLASRLRGDGEDLAGFAATDECVVS